MVVKDGPLKYAIESEDSNIIKQELITYKIKISSDLKRFTYLHKFKTLNILLNNSNRVQHRFCIYRKCRITISILYIFSQTPSASTA